MIVEVLVIFFYDICQQLQDAVTGCIFVFVVEGAKMINIGKYNCQRPLFFPGLSEEWLRLCSRNMRL